MEVSNEQWRIQECPSMENSNSELSWIWCLGLNSSWNTTSVGILVCILPLVIPTLVVLSAFVVAFSIPLGFMLAVYEAVSELNSVFLSEPREQVQYVDVFSDGAVKEEDRCDEEKIKEEGYEQDYDLLEEEEKEFEDDMRGATKARIEFGEKDNSKFQDKGELKGTGGQDYDLKEEDKYNEEKVKEEGYKQDYDLEEEEKEIEDDTRRAIEARIKLGEENHSEIQEGDDLGTESGGQLIISEQGKDKEMKKYRKKRDDSVEDDIDIEVVKEIDSSRLKMTTTEDSGISMVELDNVETEKLRKQKKRTIRDDEKKQAEDENVIPETRVESPFMSWGSSGSFGNLEQLLEPPDKETDDVLQEDCGDVEEQVQNVEPGEFVRETMHLAEAVRNEGEVEIDNIQQSMEKAASMLPDVSGTVSGAVLDLERVKLLSIEEHSIDDIPRLQTINEQLATKKKKRKDDALASIRMEIERTSSTTMKFVPQEVEQLNPDKDIGNVTYRSMYEKKFEGTETGNTTGGVKDEKRREAVMHQTRSAGNRAESDFSDSFCNSGD